jgi:hypothetical protein
VVDKPNFDPYTGERLADPAGDGDTGLNFYRPTGRVVPLLLVASVGYLIWWYWQLFTFAERERFPRARSFWWLLVPFYNFVVLYRLLDDASDAAKRAGVRTFNAALAISLAILATLAGYETEGSWTIWIRVGLGVASVLAVAAMGALVQPSANAYLQHRYPTARPHRFSWGEVTAVAISLASIVIPVTAGLITAVSGSSSAPTIPPASSSSSHPAAATPPAAGWTTATSTGGGFSIALPPHWVQVTPKLLQEPTVKVGLKAHPAFRRYVESLERPVAAGELSMAAIDLASAGTNLVGIGHRQDSASAAQIADEVATSASKNFTNPHVTSAAPPFPVNADEARFVIITGDLALGGRAIPATQFILAAVKDHAGVVVNMTVPSARALKDRREFFLVGRSLRISP